jgi:hypothetical protein
MNEAAQFVVILGSVVVLVFGTVGVPLVLGLLGASRLKTIERRMAQIERDNEARLAEMEERIDFAERLVMQGRERGELPPGGAPAR